jgi:hypothetical protein
VAEAEMGVVERVNRFMLALAGMTLIVGCLGINLKEKTLDTPQHFQSNS